MYMKVYEAIFNEETTEGVYALSVVENPAMEDMWVALSEHPQKIEFSTVDEDKHLLLGAALIPNKKIYRNVDGHEFYITFSEETIEKLAHSFFKNQKNNNSSLEHDVKLDGMSVVEGWIVDDPNNDKSNAYGKTYEKGTWVTMMKVDNDEIWNKVKNGKVKGFSIDAVLNLQPLNLNTNINKLEMTKTDFLDAIRAMFTAEPKVEETAPEEVQVQVEEVKEEVVAAEPFDKDAFLEAVKDVISAEFTKQGERIEAIETKLAKEVEVKEKEVEDLKTELSKEPEAQPLKPKMEVKEIALTRQGRMLELMRKNK